MSCGTSCISHLFTKLFRLLESIDPKNVPSACLEIFMMVQHNIYKLTFLILLQCTITLTLSICLLEINRYLKCNLSQYFWLHFLIVCHLVEKVLSLCQHKVRQHCQSFCCEIRGDLPWFQKCHILFEIIKYPSRLLHQHTRCLDAITFEAHISCLATQAHAIIIFGAQCFQKWVVRFNLLMREGVCPYKLHWDLH